MALNFDPAQGQSFRFRDPDTKQPISEAILLDRFELEGIRYALVAVNIMSAGANGAKLISNRPYRVLPGDHEGHMRFVSVPPGTDEARRVIGHIMEELERSAPTGGEGPRFQLQSITEDVEYDAEAEGERS